MLRFEHFYNDAHHRYPHGAAASAQPTDVSIALCDREHALAFFAFITPRIFRSWDRKLHRYGVLVAPGFVVGAPRNVGPCDNTWRQAQSGCSILFDCFACIIPTISSGDKTSPSEPARAAQAVKTAFALYIALV